MSTNNTPFSGELENLKHEGEFDLHKLGRPEKSFEIPGGREKEFAAPEYGVTEYFDSNGKNHEQFTKLKNFYESAQAELGDFLPKAMFVEGGPSDQTAEGRSFYVVQKYESDEFYRSAKKLQDLNSQEFTTEFVNQLLEIQDRIVMFMEKHAEDIPDDWMELGGLMQPQKFKEDILHSPQNGQTQITNLFRFNPELVQQISGNNSKYEPSTKFLQMLKMLGLGNLSWAIEKSGFKEWTSKKHVHWSMNSEKLEQEGKKAMALTFDDGPNEETEKLLDILKAENVKGTFFLVGSLIPGNEHIVKRIVDEGHDVGVHEWSQEGAKPNAGIKEYGKRFVGPRSDLGDVKDTAELINKVSGARPALGRVAGVHGTIDSRREFEVLGLKVIHGNPYDVAFMPPSPKFNSETLYKKAMSSNGQGRIRIFHIGTMKDTGLPMERSEVDESKGETYPPDATLGMIQKYIAESKKQGYEFVKVNDYT